MIMYDTRRTLIIQCVELRYR